MKVKIEVNRCVGHARCAAVAPEVFTLSNDGFNVTPEQTVEPAFEDKARRGARACPEKIILIEEIEKS